jgi:predicted nucleotidyltransferase
MSARREIQVAYIFGSVVSGRTRPDSDVDIAVLVDRRVRPAQMLKYRLKLMADLGAVLRRADIEVVILNQAPPLLAHRVLSQGKLVFERFASARVRFQVMTASRYCDLIPMFETHIRYLKRIGKTNGIFARRSGAPQCHPPANTPRSGGARAPRAGHQRPAERTGPRAGAAQRGHRWGWTRTAGWGRVGPARGRAGGAAGRGGRQRVGYTCQSVTYLYDTAALAAEYLGLGCCYIGVNSQPSGAQRKSSTSFYVRCTNKIAGDPPRQTGGVIAVRSTS